MFFIVTTGRSGSTSIARTLDRVSGLHAVHEPAPELTLEAAGYTWGTVTREEIEALLQETRQPEANGEVYCESNQNLSFLIPLLAEIYPEARFIWLIRNGMDVVASAYQKQWYTGHSENHDRYEDCTPLEKAWVDGRARADRAGLMSESDWEKLPRFDKCCWYWGHVNHLIGKELSALSPGRHYTLRLEEADDRLPELIHWMGFDPQPVASLSMDNLARRTSHHWTAWSEVEHQAFTKWCGAEMDRHYPGWSDLVREDAARIFITPMIRTLTAQVETTREQGEQMETHLRVRILQLKTRLDWIEDHWSFKWYHRLRRLMGDRGGGTGTA